VLRCRARCARRPRNRPIAQRCSLVHNGARQSNLHIACLFTHAMQPVSNFTLSCNGYTHCRKKEDQLCKVAAERLADVDGSTCLTQRAHNHVPALCD
jgi:hypothetical protein